MPALAIRYNPEFKTKYQAMINTKSRLISSCDIARNRASIARFAVAGASQVRRTVGLVWGVTHYTASPRLLGPTFIRLVATAKRIETFGRDLPGLAGQA
jgi:hypothetical protein